MCTSGVYGGPAHNVKRSYRDPSTPVEPIRTYAPLERLGGPIGEPRYLTGARVQSTMSNGVTGIRQLQWSRTGHMYLWKDKVVRTLRSARLLNANSKATSLPGSSNLLPSGQIGPPPSPAALRRSWENAFKDE